MLTNFICFTIGVVFGFVITCLAVVAGKGIK